MKNHLKVKHMEQDDGDDVIMEEEPAVPEDTPDIMSMCGPLCIYRPLGLPQVICLTLTQ